MNLETNEFELLLLCARRDLAYQQVAMAKEFATGRLDWELIFETATSHNLHSLLYRNLKKICLDDLPSETANALQKSYMTTAAGNLVMSVALEKILDKFAGQGVAAVPFKGPVLALSAYQHLSTRGFNDLDILIKPADLETACGILKDSGYRPELDLDAAQLSAFTCHEDNLTFYKDSRIIIELHWELSGLYLTKPVGLRDLQSPLKSVKLVEHEVPQLPAVTQLVYLCVHGTKHMWERLEWLSCIHELAAVITEKQWIEALDLAAAWQCRRMFLLAFKLSRELLGTELPKVMRAEIDADPCLNKLDCYLQQRLFHASQVGSTNELKNRFSLFHLQVRDNASDRIHYLLRLLFRPTKAEWCFLSLPASLSFCYYALRSLRLMIAGVRRGKSKA